MAVSPAGATAAADPVAALVDVLEAAQPGAVRLPDYGQTVNAVNDPGFMIRGCNLGIGPDPNIDTKVFWGSGYDWAGHIKPNIDRIVEAGFNTIRIQGTYSQWLANPSQYLTRYLQVMDYCMGAGLRVLYCLTNRYDDTLASADRTSHQTMIAALVTPYAANPKMIGWDIGNELGTDVIADQLTMATHFATDIRAVDSTAKITCSVSASSTMLMNAGTLTPVDSFVDFHDIHVYTPVDAGFQPNWLDQVRVLTSKPFMIGEFGANYSDTGAVPHAINDDAHGAYYGAFRRYAAGGGIMGFICWTIQDDKTTGTASQFGLYTTAGVARPALDEMMKYPVTRVDAAADAVTYRTVPVVIDNFSRANSASSVGTPAIGAAPTAVAGTWGITSKRLKVQTGLTGGNNILVWESNAADAVVEFEGVPAAAYNLGVVFRYQDSSNFWCLVTASASSPRVRLFKVTAGSFAQQASSALYDNYYTRWKVNAFGSVIQVSRFDRVIMQVTDTAFQNATKHGVLTYTPDDGGSTFRSFSVQIPARYF